MSKTVTKKTVAKKTVAKRIDPSKLSNIRWDKVMEAKRAEMSGKIVKILTKANNVSFSPEAIDLVSKIIAKGLITRNKK